MFWRTPGLCRECPPALAPGPPRAGWGAAERWAGLLFWGGACPRPPPPPPSPSLTAPLPPAIFCDYYNPPGECEWHYGALRESRFETCRTVNSIHSNISTCPTWRVRGPRGVLPRMPEARARPAAVVHQTVMQV